MLHPIRLRVDAATGAAVIRRAKRWWRQRTELPPMKTEAEFLEDGISVMTAILSSHVAGYTDPGHGHAVACIADEHVEAGTTLGLVMVVGAMSVEALRQHVDSSGKSADEVLRVMGEQIAGMGR